MPALTAERMLRIVSAAPEVRLAAAEKLSGITPLVDCRMLNRLTANGTLTASVIYIGNDPLYVVWWHKTSDSGLHLNAVVQVENKSAFSSLVKAIDAMAANLGCSYIRFNTRRSGLVVKSQEWGYDAESLTMIKRL